MPNSTYWTTEKEIEYIKIIGENYFTGLSRIQLLTNYLLAMPKRKQWENMNKSTIRSFVNKEIRKEMSKTTKYR